MSVEIIPSILVKTKEEFLDKVITIEPYADQAHIDVADGIFVPNMTIDGVEELEEVESSLRFGVHLMVSKPENHIHRWLQTQVERIVFHIEATKKSREIIDAAKEGEKLIGIALNPKTPVSEIEPFVDSVDFVHFMTVEPGFNGGAFVDSVIDKISDFHYFYPDKEIEVDGGVTPETAPRLIAVGATLLVVGSYIWQNHDAGKAIENLKNLI
ncbi:MAG: ribulose-phosphate 3-epimerase [Minisyncoccia bacterium]